MTPTLAETHGMMNYPTMPKSKIAVTLDDGLLQQIDHLVRARAFPNRSQAIEQAVGQLLTRRARTRLAEECAKLDPAAEAAMADEGVEDPWPDY
jgi:Arc/MetJ-type ribon-helix-helix transcriptional regulator